MKTKKIAIRVSNEREFKALMAHYESKGWLWCEGSKPFIPGQWSRVSNGNKLIQYSNHFCHDLYDEGADYDIVSFSAFAQLTGIEIPADEVVIEISHSVTKAVVTIDRVDFKANGVHSGVYWLSAKDIREIAAALASFGCI